MAEKLKELLEKINRDGVKQAEEKASAIESKAKNDAEKILQNAEAEAKKIVKEAETTAKKTKETTEIALKQANRNLILSLKADIRKIFDKIIVAETAKTISQQELASILGSLIKEYVEKNGETSDIKVLLKKEDLEKLKKTFISNLKERLKKGIEFKASPNISAGFSISFDKGKSFFDFTDEGLGEALCAYLNPELSKLFE